MRFLRFSEKHVEQFEKLSVGRVSSFTELFVRLQLLEFDEHYRKVREHPLTIWVSYLVACPLKWFYTMKYPEIARATFRGCFVLGKLAHLGLQQLAKLYAEELGFRQVEIEKDVEKRINVDLNDLPRIVRLSGRIDILATDEDDEKIVVEIKTARSDAYLPHEHHVQQLRIYMNLANASKGVLLYITPDRVAEYTYTNPASDEELQKLVATFLRFEGPRYEWECTYCQFSSICPRKKTNQAKR